MFSLTSRNKIERRVIQVYWNDGLLDILAGLGVAAIGVAWLFSLVPLGATIPVMLIPFWKLLRGRITEPRLGFVVLSDVQGRRNRDFLITSILIGVVVFLLCIAAYLIVVKRLAGQSTGIAALPAAIVAFMALMTAAITSVNRFILYSAILLICGIAVALLDGEPGWSLLAGGLVIVISGGITLSRFISQYPIHSEGAICDESSRPTVSEPDSKGGSGI